MRSCCYGLLAWLSFACSAMPESEFEALRAPLLKAASQNYAKAVTATEQLISQNALLLTLEQKIRLLYHKAIFQDRSNKTQAALETLAQCKTLSLDSADRSILYSYHSILGGIFNNQGLYAQALAHYQQALPLALLLANPFFLHQLENNLALVLVKLGQYDEAKQYFQRFLQQGKQDQDASVQAVALNNLGEVAMAEGQVSDAEKLHQQALTLRVLHKLENSWSFLNLARVALARRDAPAAIILAQHSLQLRAERQFREQAEAGLVLAEAYLQAKQYAAADRQIQQSLQLAAQALALDLTVSGWQLQAALAEQQQKPAQAVVALQQLLQAQQQLNDQRYNLSMAQQTAELGVASREIEINQLKQRQASADAAYQARQRQLLLVLGSVIVVLVLSLLFARQIRQKNHALAHSLAELERTRQQLVEERKLAALTHLVSGIAHQLNTPLGTMLTAASCSREQLLLLQQKLADKKLNLTELEQFIAEQQQLMQLAESSTQRASGLVERFKLISAKSQQSSIETVELKPFIRQWLQAHLALQPRQVALQIEGDDVTWCLDTQLLGKVLSALADNALQHADSGPDGLQLRLKLQSQAGDNEAPLLLYFCDNGLGIPAELSDKIFDPFFTTKLSQGNLGLGLSIAYNQLQGFGGSLEYLPDQAGCCFLIRLPAMPH